MSIATPYVLLSFGEDKYKILKEDTLFLGSYTSLQY